MSESRFEGQWLTEYLEDYHQITLRAAESGWDLRKRAFVEVFPADPVAAIEFLYGCHKDELSLAGETGVMILMMSRQTSETLKRFADGLAGDPILSRTKRQKTRR